MESTASAAFGRLMKQRRKALDLRQGDLARRSACSVEAIRKIEAGVFRPSRELAELLAGALEVPEEERAAFVRMARAGAPSEGHRSLKPPTNLGTQPTTFIGRSDDIAAIASSLGREDTRLLTLTGPPGIGKTRLAIRSAETLLNSFPDGVYFVALASTSDPDRVLPRLAHTLGVREVPGESLLEALKRYLRSRQMLLVLDNFEQLLGQKPGSLTAAVHVADLLASAPGLKIMATSREMLHIYGEREMPVRPLLLPGSGRTAAAEDPAGYEAVRLFIERAQAIKPDFTLTPENTPAVVEICARLDGLPLAIELATTQIKALTPEAILSRLGSSLALLTGGPHDLAPRQQTLRGAIDWSYNLLDPHEQSVFRGLAVFVGGCTLHAAEAVSLRDAEYSDVSFVDSVRSLVDKSLLRQESYAGEPRYSMLATIGEYARERLERSGEGLAQATRRRHALYFLEMTSLSEKELMGPDQAQWLDRLERDHDNLRAAISFCLQTGDVETAAGIAAGLRRFWYLHGHMSEGRRLLEEVLAHGDGLSPGNTARVIHGIGTLAWSQGDYERARSCFEESLRIWRDLGDKEGIANMLHNLGVVALPEADYDSAYAYHEESLRVYRELDDRWSIALSLANLGLVALNRGDTDGGYLLLQESLQLRREIGEKQSIAQSLNNLGVALRCRGDHEGAKALHLESLQMFDELGDTWSVALTLVNLGLASAAAGSYSEAGALHARGLAMFHEMGVKQGMATSLEGLAKVAACTGRNRRSATLLGAAHALREAIAVPQAAIDRADYDRHFKAVSARLGSAAFQAAWDAGLAMTIDQAVDYALEDSPLVAIFAGRK